MNNARSIRDDVKWVYSKLTKLSVIVFLIALLISSLILYSGKGALKMSFFGFIGVIIFREIIVMALVTLLLIIVCKNYQIFGSIANYVGVVLQAVCSVIWLVVTMVRHSRPNNGWLCVVGVLLALVIIVLFCVLAFCSVFSNIKYLSLVYYSSELLEDYHSKQVALANEYNPVIEKDCQQNSKIPIIIRKLGSTNKKTASIDINEYPTCHGDIGLFYSEYYELIKYVIQVQRYTKKVDNQSKKLEKKYSDILKKF